MIIEIGFNAFILLKKYFEVETTNNDEDKDIRIEL